MAATYAQTSVSGKKKKKDGLLTVTTAMVAITTLILKHTPDQRSIISALYLATFKSRDSSHQVETRGGKCAKNIHLQTVTKKAK